MMVDQDMEKDVIVTLNSGSSSLRCAVFDRSQRSPEARLRFSLRCLPDAMNWERRDARTGETEEARLDPPDSAEKAQETALAEMKDRLLAEIDPERIAAFSHRVVHGGREYGAPVQVDGEVMERLTALTPMVPSHQPHNLAAIRDLAERFPRNRQIACFDTAFHRDLPHSDQVFALPKDMAEEGILRYGFHGLSYDHVASALGRIAPEIARGARRGGASGAWGKHVRPARGQIGGNDDGHNSAGRPADGAAVRCGFRPRPKRSGYS